MAKSLLRDDIADVYPLEQRHPRGWFSPLIELLRELLRRASVVLNKTSRTDYSKMTYNELRDIADNDAIADSMSNEDYESLSVELWRKFSAERGLTQPTTQAG